MSWFLLAIIGHLSNAVSFIIDKSLLKSALKHSATYAAMIGAISLIAVVASPWVHVWPSGEYLLANVGFGVMFVLALWGFFEALKRGEASRVVPLIGSLIPIFTFAGTSLLFHERLTTQALAGFVCLLVATALLTRGGKAGKLDAPTIVIAMASAFCFAVATLFGKKAFEHPDIVGVFIESRVFAGIAGLVIGLSVKSARKELQRLFFGTKKKKAKDGHGTGAWAVVGQIFGSVGFVLVHLAIREGSASLVNALQAVQYAAIVLIAWFGGAQIRKMLQEERTPHIIFIKSLAILLTGIGLALVATGAV